MVTGDQPATARSIGSALDIVAGGEEQVLTGKKLQELMEATGSDDRELLEARIIARVAPKQKLELIELHQKAGSVVAMTGDGVNDAPALKKADIGVAMGGRGTQVAKEAADLILKDDAFGTIVVAIEQGRAIFNNIRKFILFLLSGNVSEIMIVFFALLLGAPLPLLPLQILYLNMIGDVFPALALGLGKGDPEVMNRGPRDPREGIIGQKQWIAIAGYGFLITVCVLTGFLLSLYYFGMNEELAVTISFLSLAFARLWHVFNMRDWGSAFISNDVTRNPYVWEALALCMGLLVMAVHLPGISLALNLIDPGATGWLLILGISLTPLVIVQILKSVKGRSKN
jgi:Ca2+-transporting ATPase